MKAEYLDHMGNDLTVVNAARVSFSKESTSLDDSDRGLIQFLARGCQKKDWEQLIENASVDFGQAQDTEAVLKYVKNMPTHWTPFSHPKISMRETVPIFVARQRFKHMVGFTYNEVSRRYVSDDPEFYVPDTWRSKPAGSVKQGSAGTHPNTGQYRDEYQHICTLLENQYNLMIEDGVAPEQARMILPQSMLTTYWVTGSLYAWANAYIQRSDSHAQAEIQELAKQWDGIISPLFPVSWEALTK